MSTAGVARRPRGLTVLLWVARGTSGLIVLLMAVTLISGALDPEGIPPTADEAVALALFPVGMCIGYIAAWKWPLWGGVVSCVCVAVFLLLMREPDVVPPVVIMTLPAVMFVVYGLLMRWRGRPATEDGLAMRVGERREGNIQ